MKKCFQTFKMFKLNKLTKFNFCAEIKIKSKGTDLFYPIKGVPEFKQGLYTVFEYTPEPIKTDAEGTYQRLPQVPYEIKEYTMKATLYTFFLSFFGRLASNFSYSFVANLPTFWSLVPASVFTFFYSRTLWKMYNTVIAIRLKEDGKSVIFEYKNGLKSPLEVEIRRIKKNREENFLLECYAEPFLFPIIVDYNDVYGKFSLRNKREFYIYGDSHTCIKHGEILRAILNSQSIKTK